VFYDPRGCEKKQSPPACRHAKCILVDGVTAFFTSANITESAHERNIELGVLFRENRRNGRLMLSTAFQSFLVIDEDPATR
jgi:phosphatidylserine/phosphatidylglycerophosphate/cardiolipin synthase-like enzyme